MGHKTALVTAALIIIVINIESKNIVKMFTDNPELIDMASKGLICYTSGMFFLGANFINISYLQSMEKALLSFKSYFFWKKFPVCCSGNINLS